MRSAGFAPGTLPAALPHGASTAAARLAPLPPASREAATESIAQLEARLRENGPDAALRVALARAYLEADQPGEAFLQLRLAEASPEARGEVRRLLGMAHLGSRDLPAAVEDLLAASRALPMDATVRAALDEALEGLLEPTPEERSAAEAALESLVGGLDGAEPIDPFAAPDDAEAAVLGRWLGTLIDSGVEPAELVARQAGELGTESNGAAAASGMGESHSPDAAERPSSAEEGAARDREAEEGVDEPAEVSAPGGAGDARLAEPAGDDSRAIEVASSSGDSTAADLERPAAMVSDPGGTPPPSSATTWHERQLDLHRLRRSLVAPTIPGHPSTAPSTVILRSRGSRVRRTAIAAAACALLGMAAFGTVVTRGRGQEEPATARPGRGAKVPAVADPEPALREPTEEPSEVAEGELPAVEPAPRTATTAPLRPDGGAAAVQEEQMAPVELPPPPPPGYEKAPRYEFMDRLGLPTPPGGVIDPSNSDARRLMREMDGRLSRPVVLTFRTGASVQEVASWYVKRLSNVRFNSRVVPMGGPFQGVQRTVARASTTLARGHRVVITVSRPGVDPASRDLVAETTVRIEVR